ncbi:MAG TPA: methyltransferase domain-containing protein [Gaiellaceae bacterium]|nr:methyltransferase domain-containing protein [Gaiellaceae bacterium]
MPRCCSAGEYRRFFNRKQARRDARRYRRGGLDAVSARVRDAAGDVGGQTVLEVGGGVGALVLELVRAGAARATTVELSPAYDEEAQALAREAGAADRVERRVGDFVAEAATVEPADVVILNRVVCCYPDYDALLGAAAGCARRRLVFSFPREAWWTRAGARVVNGWLRLRRCGFRTFVHPSAALVAAAERGRLRVAAVEPGRLWQVAVLDRA